MSPPDHLSQGITIPDSEDEGVLAENEAGLANVVTGPPAEEGQPFLPVEEHNLSDSQSRARTFVLESCSRPGHNQSEDHIPAEVFVSSLCERFRQQDSRMASLFNKLTSLARDIQDHREGLASAIRQQGSDVLVIYGKDRQISLQKQKLTISREAGRFTKRSGDCFTGVTKDEIKRRIGDLETGISDLIYFNDEPCPSLPSSIEDYASIEWMFRRILGFNSQSNSSLQPIPQRLSHVGTHSILRSLVATALLEWTLQSGFPSFDDGGSRVLDRYRELLALQGQFQSSFQMIIVLTYSFTDGMSALRNLDTAVHHSLISEDYFQNGIISDKAKELALRLSQMLAHFFPPEAIFSFPDGFQTWGQTEEEHRERRTKLIELFEQALKLKADLILKPEGFEMLAFAPGTTFDATSMHLDTGMAGNEDLHGDETPKIELCLFPAVFCYNEDAPTIDEDRLPPTEKHPSRMTAQYVNFAQKSDEERKEAKLIYKAVVIYQERQEKSMNKK